MEKVKLQSADETGIGNRHVKLLQRDSVPPPKRFGAQEARLRSE
jgi:hypothetical protein